MTRHTTLPRHVASLLLAAALLGCPSRSTDDAAAAAATPAAAAAPTPAAVPGAPTAPAAAPVALVRLDAGDAACYVVVSDAAGERTLPGDFELCPGGGSDATGLVGRQVTLETRPESIQADSCEGQPDCTETQTVDLVVAVRPAG